MMDTPVHDIKFVKMFQREKELGAIETGSFFVEALFTLQVVKQFSAIDKAELMYEVSQRYEPVK